MRPSGDGVDWRTVALVTTTIHVPTVLEGYVGQFERLGDRTVLIVVVGDRKTPSAIHQWLDRLDAQRQWIIYLGPEAQKEWLRRFPALDGLVPWNSIQRRNLGYLFAVERGADVIISVDDDNYVSDDDFISGHSIVGTACTVDLVASSTGWFNIGELLQTQPPTRIVPRGFPQSQRHAQPTLTFERHLVRAVVNAGLWLGDPDVDAATRLVTPAQVVGVTDSDRLPVALAPGTYCPFNSQNTAFDARLLPCMYLIVMGARYRGMSIGRYDDVWMSYFAKRVIDHLGDSVTFGRPLVHQLRNRHNVVEDLAEELPGMILTETLLRALNEVELRESSYLSAYIELIEGLREVLARPVICGTEERAFLNAVLDGMEIWATACQEVNR